MLAALSRGAFSMLGASGLLKRVASRYGMREPHSFARRFVAGETLEEAIAAARGLEAQGLLVTIDRLGEQVSEREAALAATRAYIGVIHAAAAAGITKNLSVKLTQIGLDIDRATATDNLRRVLDAASSADFFVRIDMESSAYTAQTLEIFDSLWKIGCRNIGVVIQSCLRRSMADVQHLNALGARVRLVKGAYVEPREVAFQDKADVDAQFVELMRVLLTDGQYPAIATHDPVLIDETRRFADRRGLRPRPVRVSDALRHPARPAGLSRQGRPSRPGLRAVRARMVPLLHAPARRATRQRVLRPQEPVPRRPHRMTSWVA